MRGYLRGNQMTFIISELSGNHGGDLNKAREMIWWSAKCGCDAVKFQLYRMEDFPGMQFDPKVNFPIPIDWLDSLFDTSRRAGIPLFASVFAPWAVAALSDFAPFAYKIASPESTRLDNEVYTDIAEMIHNEFAKLFVSSGTSDMAFMEVLRPDRFFYCKAGYPATIDDKDLLLISQMRDGFSDHTVGINSTLAMIKAGASYIEKHFKMDDECVDAEFSISPAQMTLLCKLA